MGLPQDELDRISEQVNSVLDKTKRKPNPFSLVGKDNSNNNNASNLQDAEENPNSDQPWVNNFQKEREDLEAQRQKTQRRSKAYFRLAKKKGPLTAIILTLVGGGIGISGLLSPALLIVNLKEIMVNKFNNQLTSMDVRTTKILTKKATTGICTSTISISCKYSKMSTKQIANFEKAGITVELEGTKPTGFKFKGKTIPASEFSKTLGADIEFRSAVKVAYNPKFAGFSDSIWAKAAAKLGISRRAVDLGEKNATDEERLKNVQKDTKIAATEGDPPAVGSKKPDGTQYTKEDVDAFNKFKSDASAVGESGVKAGTSIIDHIKGATATTGTIIEGTVTGTVNAVGVVGLGTAACTVYNSVKAVGYAAKTVRALQLARYAMIFLNVADQIKAGDAKEEDVSYLGKVLTTEVNGKSATDSYGYQYAAYGNGGTMSTSASQFLTGGGFTGELIGVTALIDSYVPNKSTCGVLTNPFVVLVSTVVGGALFLIPVVDGAVAWWDIAKAGGIALLMGASAFLPAMLKDIVAGVLVDKTTVGEAAGDAITSGASGMMGTVAATGGNAPLTPSQAVAYNDLSNNIAAQYSEEDALAYSPLDPTNSNTFMGKIVAQLVPYASKMSSLSGTLGSLMSLTTKSIASITSTTTKATDTGIYTMCQDYDYKALGLATDPYCNVIYGIPTEALNTDPIAVSDALSNSGQIDKETGIVVPNSNYEKFIKNCINREVPLGSTGPEGQVPDGSECLFNDANKNYYLYFIDQRVENGMDQ